MFDAQQQYTSCSEDWSERDMVETEIIIQMWPHKQWMWPINGSDGLDYNTGSNCRESHAALDQHHHTLKDHEEPAFLCIEDSETLFVPSMALLGSRARLAGETRLLLMGVRLINLTLLRRYYRGLLASVTILHSTCLQRIDGV